MPSFSTTSPILLLVAFSLSTTGAAPAQDEPPVPRLPRDETDRIKRPSPPAARAPRAEDPEDRLIPRNRVRPRDDRPDRVPLPPLGPPSAPGRPGLGTRGTEDFAHLRREYPELVKLLEADRDYDRQSRYVAERYHRATENERDAIRRELAEVVTKHFEARQQRRELELKRIEEQLKRLRDAVKRRQDSRQQIIDRRVSELVGTEDF